MIYCISGHALGRDTSDKDHSNATHRDAESPGIKEDLSPRVKSPGEESLESNISSKVGKGEFFCFLNSYLLHLARFIYDAWEPMCS